MPAQEPIRSLDEPFDAPEDPIRRRLLGMGAFVAVGMAGLVGQLWRLQILGGTAYREQADNNRFRLQRVEAPRGVIYDRNHVALARNRPSYAIAVVPADLPKPPDRVFRRLASLIGLSSAEIASRVSARAADPFSPLILRSRVEPKLAYMIEERSLELPGVQVVIKPVRDYVDGRLASHLVGYVGRIDQDELELNKSDTAAAYAADDDIGKMGVEIVREADLRGREGQKQSEVDAAGRELRVLAIDAARSGNNLVLSLDMPLQREITRLLLEGIGRFESASAVVLDPRDGQVLSMVHLPAFDNNIFSRQVSEEELAALLNDPLRPLVNGAIATASPPGAIFELVTAIAALQSDVLKPTTRIDCTGLMLLPNRLSPGGAARFPCWTAHGAQECATALANSCNVFFYQAGGGDPRGEWEGLGIDRLADWAGRLGLGQPTGIELPNELAGHVPNQAWKRQALKEDWFKGDTYNTAIGQGFVTATPLQLANLAAIVANGGKVYRPRIVLHTTDEHGKLVRESPPVLERDLNLSPELLDVVRRGLRYGLQIGRTDSGASYAGTAWTADLRDVQIAGKTASAEWGPPGPDGKAPTHGWFVGYAPYHDPQIAFSIFLRRGEGTRDAAQIARRLVAFYFGVEAG